MVLQSGQTPQQYWATVREYEADLRKGKNVHQAQGARGGEFVYIAAIRGEQVQTAAPKIAAQCLVDGTHRVATKEQIEAYEADQKKRSEEIRAEQDRRDSRVTIQLTPDMLKSVKGGK